MKTFYFHLGERLGALSGFRMAILSGNPAFEAAFHHRPLRRRPLWNGPIECTLLEYAARGSDAGLTPAEQPADVPPVRPEHRREEHRGQHGRGGRSPGQTPRDRGRHGPREK